MKKVVERYEEVSGAKINFDKSECLRSGTWRSGVPLQEPFHWRDGPVHIFRVVRARPPAGEKLVGGTSQGKSAGGYLASKVIVLKG